MMLWLWLDKLLGLVCVNFGLLAGKFLLLIRMLVKYFGQSLTSQVLFYFLKVHVFQTFVWRLSKRLGSRLGWVSKWTEIYLVDSRLQLMLVFAKLTCYQLPMCRDINTPLTASGLYSSFHFFLRPYHHCFLCDRLRSVFFPWAGSVLGVGPSTSFTKRFIQRNLPLPIRDLRFYLLDR